jgi:hypothetical protein
VRTKSVKLAPNSRELIKEIISDSVTLSGKLLLTNSNKISRLFSELIMIMKKIPHMMSLIKPQNITSKTILHTGCKN